MWGHPGKCIQPALCSATFSTVINIKFKCIWLQATVNGSFTALFSCFLPDSQDFRLDSLIDHHSGPLTLITYLA